MTSLCSCRRAAGQLRHCGVGQRPPRGGRPGPLPGRAQAGHPPVRARSGPMLSAVSEWLRVQRSRHVEVCSCSCPPFNTRRTHLLCRTASSSNTNLKLRGRETKAHPWNCAGGTRRARWCSASSACTPSRAPRTTRRAPPLLPGPAPASAPCPSSPRELTALGLLARPRARCPVTTQPRVPVLRVRG